MQDAQTTLDTVAVTLDVPVRESAPKAQDRRRTRLAMLTMLLIVASFATGDQLCRRYQDWQAARLQARQVASWKPPSIAARPWQDVAKFTPEEAVEESPSVSLSKAIASAQQRLSVADRQD